MDIEVLEKKLYNACFEGDVEMLDALMKEDKFTLARVSVSSCVNQTPLHLASMLGHFEFAKSLLSYKPDFATRLDSQGRSPLHLASANGYANIIELLLDYDTNMCRVCDEDGRTPLHLAVMNGQHESVNQLIIKLKSELYDHEGTVLHLCVMYNRLNVLILILESNGHHLLNIKDDGNTILHSATALRRIQIIKYLVTSRSEVDVNAVDKNGMTALEIIEQMPKDSKTMEIKELLTSADVFRGKESNEAETTLLIRGGAVEEEAPIHDDILGKLKYWKIRLKKFTVFTDEAPKKYDEALLVAASVIAAMAYQAALSPPGGIAGLDATEALNPPSYKDFRIAPARSLLAYFHHRLSNGFWISNTISFMGALSAILLYVLALNLKGGFIWLLRLAMWLTLTSMISAYVCAVTATTPEFLPVLLVGLSAWIGITAIYVLFVIYRLVRYVYRKT